MDQIQTIGKILTGNEERDCIHIAILPCIAAEGLSPGSEVGLVYGTTNQIRRKSRHYDLKSLGVVDPFLDQYVEKGQKVWVFLTPGTVTGMRHHWEHPDVDSFQVPKNDSEKWLREFADKWNFDYDQMITECQYSEGYVVAQGIDLHSAKELDPGDEDLFWHHIEILTRFKYNAEHRKKFTWSCSC